MLTEKAKILITVLIIATMTHMIVTTEGFMWTAKDDIVRRYFWALIINWVVYNVIMSAISSKSAFQALIDLQNLCKQEQERNTDI